MKSETLAAITRITVLGAGDGLISAGGLVLGAALPMGAAQVVPGGTQISWLIIASLAALAVLGTLAAGLGGSVSRRRAWRLTGRGALLLAAGAVLQRLLA